MQSPERPTDASARRRWSQRVTATTVAVALHVGVIAVMVFAQPFTPALVYPDPIQVELVSEPLPPSPQPAKTEVKAPSKAPAKITPPKPKIERAAVKRRPMPANIKPIPVRAQMAEEDSAPPPSLSESDLAGATTAGNSGGGGSGRCNMVQYLQAALRRDRDVQAAVGAAHRASGAKPVYVWNGDWIRNGGEDGAGLAQVREAILVEVGFAPAACKTDPVHGLVVLTLSDAPGAPRVAVGQGAWRWGDLLHPKGSREAMLAR